MNHIQYSLPQPSLPAELSVPLGAPLDVICLRDVAQLHLDVHRVANLDAVVHAPPVLRDACATDALIGRHYVTKCDSAPVQYNGIL